MSTLKVAVLSLAIPLAAAASQADAYTVLPLPVALGPSMASAMADNPVVSTQNGATRTPTCSQLEQHVGLAPSECGAYSTAELTEMYLAKFD